MSHFVLLTFIYLPQFVRELGWVAVTVHDISALIAEFIVAAIGVSDFGNTCERVITTSNRVLVVSTVRLSSSITG